MSERKADFPTPEELSRRGLTIFVVMPSMDPSMEGVWLQCDECAAVWGAPQTAEAVADEESYYCPHGCNRPAHRPLDRLRDTP